MPSSDERIADRSRLVRLSSFLSGAPDGLRDWLRDLPGRFDLPDHYDRVDEGQECGFGWAEPRFDALPRAPRTYRSGTCFENESEEMREAAVPALGEMLDASDAVLHEVRHQENGFHTDLVFADVDTEGHEQRAALAVGVDPLHDPLQRFRVWWYLVERGPMPTHQAIEHGRYTDPAKNEQHLEWLLDHGYAARTATAHVDAVVPPSIATLHAVELKLRDWECALEQAARANRSDGPEWRPARWHDRYGYADYRWVALDAGGIGPALENRERFEDAGVGLLAVCEGGSVVKHIDAVHDPRGRYTRDRAYAESQVWNRVDLSDAVLVDAEETGGARQPSLAAFEN